MISRVWKEKGLGLYYALHCIALLCFALLCLVAHCLDLLWFCFTLSSFPSLFGYAGRPKGEGEDDNPKLVKGRPWADTKSPKGAHGPTALVRTLAKHQGGSDKASSHSFCICFTVAWFSLLRVHAGSFNIPCILPTRKVPTYNTYVPTYVRRWSAGFPGASEYRHF